MIRLVIGAILLVFLVSGCRKDDRAISGKAPVLSLKNYSGETVRLNEGGQDVTLLVFWATWCQPCIMEIPSLMKLHEKYKDKNFQVVAVNVDDPQGQKVQSISANFGINYPILVGNEEIMKQFGGISALPTSFIIGRDGKIKEKLQGLLSESVLEEKVLVVLNSAL